jgi:hypothetical protein
MFGNFGDANLPERSGSRQSGTGTEKLEQQIDKLRLTVEALWRVMQEEHGYSDNDLIKKIAELDMADGKLDGRKNTKSLPTECPKCGRKTSKGNPRCMYCGEVLIVDPFE